ncbi:hypothetical protein AAMO2058_001283200 [Amorphochlora amoebiformis]
MTQMRGLTNFISDIRRCQNKKDEKNRVLKELSNIRGKFAKGPKLDSYSRRKYTWKLLYIYILGYDIDIGHVEAMHLISAKTYTEKKTGYTVCSVMFNEKDELMTMITQSVKHDLNKESLEPVQCLALSMVANVGGRTMSDALWKDVCNLLTSGTSRSTVRKKASLCMLKLFRKAPENIEIEAVAAKVIAMVGDELGVATCAVQLLIGIVGHYYIRPPIPAILFEAVPKCIKLLQKLVSRGGARGQEEYYYYGTLCPWLQIKCLRLLQFFPAPKDMNDYKRLEESLRRILEQDKKGDRKKNKSNAKHAVLFESINLIIHYAQNEELMNRELLMKSASLLGRFVALKEASIRYMGLDTMARLAKVDGTLDKIKEQLTTIQYSLHKDLDISIRKRALDMLYVMCDETNAPKIIQELLVFMRSADYNIREELVLKIAILAEKFATDLRWYIDIILKLITVAGNYVSEDIWYRVIQIVTNTENLQKYAALTMFKALKSDTIHENGIKVAGYILGEFSDRIITEKTTGADIFKAMHRHFSTSSMPTQAILLSSYAKLANASPEHRHKIASILASYREHADIEIQQRACEYTALAESKDQELMETVFDFMPPFENDSAKLIKKVEDAEIKRTGVGANEGEAKDEDEDEEEDDEEEASEEEEDDDEDEEVEFRNQTAEEFKTIMTASSGYLLKHEVLQIGVKMMAGVSHDMKMKIFYGNKSSSDLEDLKAIVTTNPAWTIKLSPSEGFTVPGKKQESQFLLATAHRPFSKPPVMGLQFTFNGEVQRVKIKLPIFTTQFITSNDEMSGSDYLNKWKSLEKEAKTIVNCDPIDDMETFKKGIVKSLHCSEVDMTGIVSNPQNILCLCGMFEASRAGSGESIKLPFLARFQLKSEMFQVSVRSSVGAMNQDIIDCVKMMYSA